MTDEYQFKIDGPYKPTTIPMGRLAAYMAALAALLGEELSVHFDEVKEGSAILVAKVDEAAQPKVRGRMRNVRLGDAPQDARKAFRTLDDLLAADNATGRLTGGGDNVIEFPGVTRPKPIKYGPVKQEGAVEGRIVRIGGTDDSIHIHLKDGAITLSAIETKPDLAKQLGRYLFDSIVRLHGVGTWLRNEGGAWELKKFKADRFEVLDDTPLREVVNALRATPGNTWGDEEDPLVTLLSARTGPEAH
ncbi:hypothetical protein [Brevundimonas guildfordensis]|uniref:Uncharacterized protein n=1 Tax=Brevundimonas guildfordensis TaxID=2762241 RepID=A0ABR8R2X5_9CAUL|nr:hypothetical protein [Brevundimonas guildfordensis]MBD7942144.1 hypothetical protein [Brevundimonas guildfordensis]